MENQPFVFELENVSFNYPYDEPVLCDVSVSIRAGERVCVLGANGSGKSTLLKLFTGLLHPQKGVFRAFGGVVNEKTFNKKEFVKSYHQRVGFIFQNPDTQLFCSTVREEIAFGPLQLGLSREEVCQRVDDVLNLLSVKHLKDKVPFKLSGGEKKKVALASVLVLNPDVLILDEPTNGLDPRTQRWLVELLVGLSKCGKTIITSTHNLELVQEISERSIVFSENHKIALDASTNEVLGNIKLLQEVNLVDDYYHRHGDGHHAHYHIHNY